MLLQSVLGNWCHTNAWLQSSLVWWHQRHSPRTSLGRLLGQSHEMRPSEICLHCWQGCQSYQIDWGRCSQWMALSLHLACRTAERGHHFLPGSDSRKGNVSLRAAISHSESHRGWVCNLLLPTDKPTILQYQMRILWLREGNEFESNTLFLIEREEGSRNHLNNLTCNPNYFILESIDRPAKPTIEP